MTPCIILAGPVGLGFGYMRYVCCFLVVLGACSYPTISDPPFNPLSAQGNNALPCISPALSSSLMIVSVSGSHIANIDLFLSVTPTCYPNYCLQDLLILTETCSASFVLLPED